MIDSIDRRIRILAMDHAADENQIIRFQRHFESAAEEYIELIREATEIELYHEGGQYIRIWGPIGCIDMDVGYGIRESIPYAVPIGDDGGGRFIFFHGNTKNTDIYYLGYGNLDVDDAIYVAPSLRDFLTKAIGFDKF